ncbi:MAG: HAD-IIIA family hydrolase [Erysipelotrichaceae bacterium]|nr:HAD-IIIA family hydrolase [Erysipelotrichaceae bacterium]
MKVVIMAGGKGTRISSIASDIPKPMIRIGEKPVLQLEIESLRDQGFKDFIITISHLGHVITDYFGDGSGFGVNIEYFNEVVPLGNAGALFEIKDKLSEDFILINGDAMMEVDMKRFYEFHKEKGALVSLLTHPNNHPYDSGLIITDKNDSVIRWLTKEDERNDYYKNIVNAGVHILNKPVLDKRIDKEKIDLDRDILKPLCGTGTMFSYHSTEYVKDMGTPERYEEVCNDYLSGKVNNRKLSNKQKAIFLDRDGTINHYVGFLRKPEEFELLPNSAEAIKKINHSEYLCIIITNQPVIARGEVTYDGLDNIHNKMETLLGNEGAFVDDIFYCPHHPDSGFEGEVKELKIVCDCRKPKPGLFYQAAEKYNIDLSRSYMIGDSDSDVEAGSNAGCKCIKIDRDGDLLKAVNEILE